MRHGRRALLLAPVVAAAGTGLAAGTADAATLTTGSACYLAGAPIAGVGAGWLPGRSVLIGGAPGTSAQALADAAGALTFTATAPTLASPRGLGGELRRVQQSVVLTGSASVPIGTQPAPDPALLSGGGQFDVVNLALDRSPRRDRAGQLVRWRPTGFAPGAPVYGHYVLRGRAVRTVALGAMPARCTTLPRRTRLIPVSRPRRGLWTIQLDTAAAWSPATPGALRERVRVR